MPLFALVTARVGRLEEDSKWAPKWRSSNPKWVIVITGDNISSNIAAAQALPSPLGRFPKDSTVNGGEVKWRTIR